MPLILAQAGPGYWIEEAGGGDPTVSTVLALLAVVWFIHEFFGRHK